MTEPDVRIDDSELSKFDINDGDYMQDVFDKFDAMNARGPITHVETYGGHWIVTGYQAVKAVGQNWRDFTSTQGPLHPPPPVTHMPPITTDPPLQQVYRKLLNPWFSPQVIADMEAAVRRHVDVLIDSFIERGECDLSYELAELLVPRVFFEEIVHVPPELVDTFMERTVGSGATPMEHVVAMNQIVADLVDVRRVRPPIGDVIDAIFDARVDGEPLSREDVLGVVLILLIGGTDTTRNVIASALWYLAEHPNLRAQIAADPGLLPDALEEFLRLYGSVQFAGRTVVSEVTIASQRLCPGEKVSLAIAAANRDPAEFGGARDFHLGRPGNRHIAFGVGVHRCLGAHLARLEIRVALEQVLSRLPDYSLRPDYVYRRREGHVHGPETVDVTFTPGPRRYPAS